MVVEIADFETLRCWVEVTCDVDKEFTGEGVSFSHHVSSENLFVDVN